MSSGPIDQDGSYGQTMDRQIADGLKERGVVVQYVLVAEVLCADGERYLYHNAGPDQATSAWGRMGMLEAAMSTERERWEDE